MLADSQSTLIAGQDRCQVKLIALNFGPDLILLIFNAAPHVGAVALAELDQQSQRAWASVLSAPGHREEQLALSQARKVAACLKRRTCVIAGIHIDSPTPKEIQALTEAASQVVDKFLTTNKGNQA